MKWIVILAALIFLAGCESQPEQAPVDAKEKPAHAATEVKPAPGETVRPMGAAGRFYPADAGELRKAVEGYMKNAGKVEVEGRVVALISPHAGYEFSGPVAGYSYAAVNGKSFDTVVVIGSHFSAAGASVLDLDYYQTPLGYVKVDSEVVKKLLVYEQFNFEPHRHREHAIETQVPFLQLALAGNFKIVAISATSTETEFVEKMAHDLVEALKGRKALLVASTDLTHNPPYEKANEIDAKMMESWKTLDGAEIVEREAELVREHPIALRDGCAMCGKAAVAIVVEAAKLLDADSIELLKYANSGDTPRGSKDEVVGYGAAVVYEKIKLGELSRAGQRFLLKVAREAITAFVTKGEIPEFKAHSEELKMKRAVFVTLMKHDKLRGCIGCFSSDEELPATVAKYAVFSATKDLTRFVPVKPEELPEISIKVSVLSEEFKKVKSVDEIVLGKHGIRVVDPRTGRSGTYLPEVPIDHNMTLETFLSKCCAEKLGVAADAWKKGKVDIYTYTTQVFGEK